MDGIAIWLLFLMFLPFLLFFWKMLLMTWKSFLFTKKKNLPFEMETRQNHLTTVSRSVDANSNNPNDEAHNNRRGSDATLKIDLPPTYDEVMKHFVDTRERAATSTTSPDSNAAVETNDTHGIVGVEVVTIPTSGQRSIV